MLKEVFIKTLSNYTEDVMFIDSLWNQIVSEYSNSKRHYHNLEHLNIVYQILYKVKAEIKNWDAIIFCLFYHDIIYKVSKNNNEEKSALVAKKVLDELNVSNKTSELVYKMIMATKGHSISLQEDINYFTDADLAILGKSPEQYNIYINSIRKEYKIYPDFMYNKGRIKVLKSFLDRRRIHKTGFFFKNFENQARENMTSEIRTLS